MRVLVTGSNGLVGSRLCGTLSAAGHAVTGVSRGPRADVGPFTYLQCDLTDLAAVDGAFERARPEVVVHCASMTAVDACEKTPALAYAANVSAAAYVAQVARHHAAHLVHVSTDYVFDGEGGPYDEVDVPNPRGVYALTKHMGEQAVRVFASSWAIARTAVVYGWPRASRTNFGAWLVSSLSRREPVKLFEDQFVSPSLADSVAAMLAEIGERRLTGIWNVAGAEVLNRVSFGEALCRVFGFDPSLIVPVKMKDMNFPSPRPHHTGLRIDKSRTRLLEKPLDLEESLKRFHRAYVSASNGAAP